MRARPILPLLLALALAGPVDAQTTAQDTLVVRADNAPIWGPQPRLVEELRIGEIEGEPYETFGRVTGVVVQDNGDVWIADDQAFTIRRVSSDGRHLGDVGRRGNGPGEFRSIAGIQRLRDGRVAAYDPRRKSVVLFDKDGRYLSSLSIPMDATAFTAFKAFVVGSDDSLYIYTSALMIPPAELRGRRLSPAEMESALRPIWLHVPKDVPVLDTVFVPLRDSADPSSRRYPFAPMPAYAATTLSAMSPLGYLVTGRTDRYAFHRTLRDGRVARIERSWTPVPAKQDERAMFENEIRPAERRRLESPSAGNIRAAEVALADVPDTKPAFWAFEVDQDGRIWVATHQEGYFRAETDQERKSRMMLSTSLGGPGPKTEWFEPLVTDVLDPNGGYLGTIRFPNNRTSIAWSSGDVLWAVEIGELDEAYLVRYRIQHQ